ncbi:hypothetical protein JHK87_016615 [Glycine soja]|nr:hypothetical protein JHK87_016615 [Glycine soja]
MPSKLFKSNMLHPVFPTKGISHWSHTNHQQDFGIRLPPPLALVRGLGPRVQLNQLRDRRVELVIPGTLGREIYVVWRGTSQDMEWINVFGVVQANDSKLIIAKSLKELKGGNKDNKGMTHETRNLSKVVIDTRKSPSLKDSKNPSDWDNLQVMLHVVVGWNGKKR